MIRLPLFVALLALLFTAGCQSAPDPLNVPLVARLFLEARSGEPAVTVQLPVSKVNIAVNPKPVFVETDITDAGLARVELGWCLMLQFTPAAGRDFYRLSVGNTGRRLVLSLNDQPAGARRIDRAMPEGALLIFVEAEDVNLPPLVERLKRTAAGLAGRKR